MAQILANMSEYIQPHSPLNFNIEIDQLQEQVVIGKDTAEGIPDEVEEENPQEKTEPVKVTTPEERSQEHMKNEEVFRAENKEASLSEGMATKNQTLPEQLSIEKGTSIPPRRKNKITELEKLQREQQKLQKLVEQLR